MNIFVGVELQYRSTNDPNIGAGDPSALPTTRAEYGSKKAPTPTLEIEINIDMIDVAKPTITIIFKKFTEEIFALNATPNAMNKTGIKK
ncbi:hypothetical protein GCM10028816_04470 [Spirosoma lituiforme]